MRIRTDFALPTSWSNGEDQMETFQTTGLKFVVWFMGFGSSRKPGKQGLFKLHKIVREKDFTESIFHKQRV